MSYAPSGRPESLLSHVIQFVMEYWESRNPVHILWGLPCIGVGICCLIAVWIGAELETRTTERYRSQANQSLTRGHYDAASLLLRRIVNRNPNDHSAWFQLAQSIHKTGNARHSQQMMRDIAPRTQRGYGPAHIWLARNRLDSTAGRLQAADFDLVLADLLRVQNNATFKVETAPLLAKLFLRQGRLKDAEPFLDAMAEQGGEQRLAAARSLQLLGRGDQALQEAQKAAGELQALLESDPDNPQRRLQLAECFALSNSPAQGERVLCDGIALEPLGPCRLGLANYYLKWSTQLKSNDDAQNESQRIGLLTKAVKLFEGQKDLKHNEHLFAAELALAISDARSAQFHLNQTEARHVIPRLNLARLFADQGNLQAARKIASAVLDFCRDQLTSPPKDADSLDNQAMRLQAAAAAELLDEVPQAIALLKQIPSPQRSESTSRALSALYVKHWDQQRTHSDVQPVSGTDSHPLDDHPLLAAFRETPWNPKVVDRMLRVARNGSPAAEQMRGFLQDQLARGQAPAVGHLLLGTDAIATNDLPRAIQHLELAFALAPEMPQISNNLAWALAHRQPPDLDRALDLVDEMLEQFPDLAELLDTRGTIYLKRRQWQQAATDFNRVLSVRPKNAQLHRSLATAYRQLGLNDLAESHARKARELPSTPRRLPGTDGP